MTHAERFDLSATLNRADMHLETDPFVDFFQKSRIAAVYFTHAKVRGDA